jgi:hypothetical protein
MKEKYHVAIFLIIFIGTFILFFFNPMGFSIFMLTTFPLMLNRTHNISNTALDFTMLIIFITMFIGAYSIGFDLDFEQTIFVFCPVVGYLTSCAYRQ